MMKHTAAADTVIFGGGIAGLWLLNRLRALGFSAILFESGALGGGQTHKAQGIIHGGMKYALQGVLTSEARALSDMPALWRQCLQGEGEIDLSDVPVLSREHYLWSPHKLTSKLAGWLAHTVLKSTVKAVPPTSYPSVFMNSSFKGEVFSVDEIVIDVPALMRTLLHNNQDAVFKIEPFCGEGLNFNTEGSLRSVTVYQSGKAVEVMAQQFIFTAGVGNEIVIKKLKQTPISMQRRPLHMVLVKTPFCYPLYAHCMGLSARPRLTITTHQTQSGETIWYLGGQLAEEGIYRDGPEQLKAAQKELRALFPWLDFSQAEFASFIVDRAEAQQAEGVKPEGCAAKRLHNIIIGWPTKLALAPKLAEAVIHLLQEQHITPRLFDTRLLRSWPMPPLAMPIWEEIFCKSVA